MDLDGCRRRRLGRGDVSGQDGVKAALNDRLGEADGVKAGVEV